MGRRRREWYRDRSKGQPFAAYVPEHEGEELVENEGADENADESKDLELESGT